MRINSRVILTCIMTLLSAGYANADAGLSGQWGGQAESLFQRTPSTKFEHRTRLVNEVNVPPIKNEVQDSGVKLALAVPVAKSGGLTFCLPLIVPQLSEPNHKGDVGVAFRADLFRGTF